MTFIRLLCVSCVSGFLYVHGVTLSFCVYGVILRILYVMC